MKFIFSFVVALLLFSSPVYAETMYVTDDVNVRTVPGFKGEIIDVLEKGDEVEVVTFLKNVKDGRRWAYIRHEGRIRSCCSEYLGKEKPVTTHLYGNCRITHYCPGACCCGRWAGSPTASGEWPQINRTVSNGLLPFGTRVLINGQEYIVEDRGVGEFDFDIFVGSHSEANQRGLYYTDVYIID